jgi:hypothetical protein
MKCQTCIGVEVHALNCKGRCCWYGEIFGRTIMIWFVKALVYFYAGRAIMLRHSSAHLWHSMAQRLQCSKSIFCSHSVAQNSHISAQVWQRTDALSPFRAINLAVVSHIRAHSRFSDIQRESIFISSSLRHSVAQRSHSAAHEKQASIQLLYN